MQLFLDQLLNGLTAGAEYALVAAGLALVFGVLEIVNFAHGDLFMLGAYLLYVSESGLGLSYVPAAIVALLGMAVVGGLFYGVVIRRILNRGWQVQIVATLAVSILLVNLVIVTAGSLPKDVFSPLTDDILRAGSLNVSTQRILVLAAAVVSFAGLALYLRRTRTGKAMRALAQNRQAAAVVGMPVERIGLAAVVAACVLAGVASVTISPLYHANPTMGTLVVIKAFAAVIMGGFGNVTGAIASAFLLGLAEAFAIGYVSSDYADALVFGIMICVLLFKPHGLLGRAVRA